MAQAADIGRHHGATARLCLQCDKSEGLVVGRHRDYIGHAVPTEELRALRVRSEVHHVRDTVINGQRAERLGPLRVGATRATDDDQLQLITARRIAPHQLRHRLDQHVGRLQRLDAAHEQDHLNVLCYAEVGSRFGLVAGMKCVQVDTRRHDHDLRVAGAVVAVEFSCFVAGAGCQHVGFADDCGLAALPYVWLG